MEQTALKIRLETGPQSIMMTMPVYSTAHHTDVGWEGPAAPDVCNKNLIV